MLGWLDSLDLFEDDEDPQHQAANHAHHPNSANSANNGNRGKNATIATSENHTLHRLPIRLSEADRRRWLHTTDPAARAALRLEDQDAKHTAAVKAAQLKARLTKRAQKDDPTPDELEKEYQAWLPLSAHDLLMHQVQAAPQAQLGFSTPSSRSPDTGRQVIDKTDLTALQQRLGKPKLALEDIPKLDTQRLTPFQRGGLEAHLAAKQAARPRNDREAWQRAWSAILAYDPAADPDGSHLQDFHSWLGQRFAGPDLRDLRNLLHEHLANPEPGRRLAEIFHKLDNRTFEQKSLGPPEAGRLRPIFAGLRDQASGGQLSAIKSELLRESPGDRVNDSTVLWSRAGELWRRHTGSAFAPPRPHHVASFLADWEAELERRRRAPLGVSVEKQDGREEIIVTGVWRQQDLPALFELREFKAAEPEARKRILNDVLNHAYANLAESGGLSHESFRSFGAAAADARQRLARMESLWEKTAGVAGIATDGLTAAARAAVALTTDTSLLDPDFKPKAPLANVLPQTGYWFRHAGDTLHVWTRPPEGVEAALTGIKEQIDHGALPLDDPDKLSAWLEEKSQLVSSELAQWYDEQQAARGTEAKDAWPRGYEQTNGLLHPLHAALLGQYLRTRDPEAWEALRQSLLITPWRARTNAEQAHALRQNAMVRFLTDNIGPGIDYGQFMAMAGDPIQLALMALPHVRAVAATARGAAGAGQVSAHAARASAAGQAAAAGAMGAGLGAVNTAVFSPNGTWQDYQEAAKQGIIIALGMHGAASAARAGYGLVEKGVIRGSSLERWADDLLATSRQHVFTSGDPQLGAAAIIKGAALIEGGVSKFEDWSGHMVEDLGEGIRPHLDTLWQASLRYHSEQQGKALSQGPRGAEPASPPLSAAPSIAPHAEPAVSASHSAEARSSGGNRTAETPPPARPRDSVEGSNPASKLVPELEWLVPKRIGEHLEPIYPYDSLRRPKGTPKALRPNQMTEARRRGADGENECATVAAQYGYEVEQLPEGLGSADLKINGLARKVDVFSPAKSKSLKGIRDEIERKVAEQNAEYIFVRLENEGQSPTELATYLRSHPPVGLKQLIIVQNGKLTIAY